MENVVFKIVTPQEVIKFYINKVMAKNSLSFNLASVSGKLPKLKDKKFLHPFFN